MKQNNTKFLEKLEGHQRLLEDKKRKDEIKKDHLTPIKHPQKDFFIADIFDNVSFQNDIASMEHPLFALKAGDYSIREYINGNTKIIVRPTLGLGMATIHDKDIWIYCISKLMQAINDGEEISRTVHFTIYDYLITTNRGVSGEYYIKAKNALERLSGTRITTNIETDRIKEANGFGLIDSWRIIEEKDGRMIRVSVTLPEWLYRSVISKSVLTISPDYFRLRKPLDRRVYELARKHCGNQSQWVIGLELLHKKTGATMPTRNFRIAIKSLAESDQLPDYHSYYLTDKDQVLFKPRDKQQELI